VLLSPDQQRIAWSITNDDLPPDQQVAAVWIANLDSSGARQVATLRRGSLSGWISEDALLVSGRENAGGGEQVLSVLLLADGTLTELARADRLRSPQLSPSGAWVAFYTTFAENSAQNGLWLARTAPAPEDRPQMLPRELFGSYQWRGCPTGCSPEQDRLIIVPFLPDAEHHHFLELDPVTLAARPLSDPQVTPVKIANGDWRISPNGRYVAFVESRDRNIWIIALP
jgi:Tol biopolymer transport system component